MSRIALTLAAPLVFAVWLLACDDKKSTVPPAPPAVSAPAASPSVPVAPVAASGSVVVPTASAAPASSKDPETQEPDDSDEETAGGDITSDTYEKEIDALEKEVGGKY